MRKTVVFIVISAFLLSALSCANWNKMTPKPLDNTAIEEEIRKNMLGDGITGMKIDVNDGVVTIQGDVKTASQKQKALDDARKVHGVKRVIDHIAVKP
jgi:osmotically-inducible protein OsmY